MKHRILASALALTGVLALALPAAAAENVLVVANKADDTVYLYDTQSLEKIGETTTGRGPHEVAITPDRQHAWIANTEGPGDSMSIIDLEAGEELRQLDLGPGHHPHGLQFTEDGRWLYVTVEGVQGVIEIDVQAEQVTRTMSTDDNSPHMLRLSPDEQRVYTSNLANGNVTVLDRESGEVLTHIETGAGAEGIDVTHDGSELWISNREADTISIIDTESFQIIDTLECEGFPLRLEITPDGERALVSCMNASEVAVFDLASREQIERFSSGDMPIGMVFEPDGSRAYIANTGDGTAAVVDLETYEVLDTLEAGANPDGIGLAPGNH